MLDTRHERDATSCPARLTQRWFKDGMLHRDFDLPAVVRADGDQEWFRAGTRHRDGDMPAVVRANGHREWFSDGKRHRDGDMPAIMNMNSTHQEWYADDILYRGDFLMWPDGCSIKWFKDGMKHRDVGPACVMTLKDPLIYWYNFFTQGVERGAKPELGETIYARAPASWSPMLCFV